MTASGTSLPARLADFRAFVADTVHPATARILEVGCGSGALANALAEVGYDVTAVDPNAPDGARFRRGRIEDFTDDQPYDAVVASLSLHHVDELDAAVDRVAELSRPGGPLLVDEFARERFTGATAEWYYLQRRALAAVGGDAGEVPDDFESWQRRWFERHGHIHTLADVRTALARRFEEVDFSWRTYLYSYHLDDALEPLERSLIAQELLTATGCRFLGARR